MRVAAYQAPLLTAGSMDALSLIRKRVEWCEAAGVTLLCCPEAILGGLADYGENPVQFAIAAVTAGSTPCLRHSQATLSRQYEDLVADIDTALAINRGI